MLLFPTQSLLDGKALRAFLAVSFHGKIASLEHTLRRFDKGSPIRRRRARAVFSRAPGMGNAHAGNARRPLVSVGAVAGRAGIRLAHQGGGGIGRRQDVAAHFGMESHDAAYHAQQFVACRDGAAVGVFGTVFRDGELTRFYTAVGKLTHRFPIPVPGDEHTGHAAGVVGTQRGAKLLLGEWRVFLVDLIAEGDSCLQGLFHVAVLGYFELAVNPSPTPFHGQTPAAHFAGDPVFADAIRFLRRGGIAVGRGRVVGRSGLHGVVSPSYYYGLLYRCWL